MLGCSTLPQLDLTRISALVTSVCFQRICVFSSEAWLLSLNWRSERIPSSIDVAKLVATRKEMEQTLSRGALITLGLGGEDDSDGACDGNASNRHNRGVQQHCRIASQNP